MKTRLVQFLLPCVLVVHHSSPSQHPTRSLSSPLVPFGLEGKRVTSLAMEYPEAFFPDSRNHPLVAGTVGEGVFKIFPFDSLSEWKGIGLQKKSISALTVQHWGAGPFDGNRAFAAVIPDGGKGDTLLYAREVLLEFDTVWTPADSGLDRASPRYVRSLNSYYYTGDTPPLAIILGGDGGLYYGSFVWSPAAYDGIIRINAIDVNPHWFGSLAWAAGQQGLSPVALQSIDQGKSWKTIFLPLLIEGEAFSVAVNPKYPDTVYAGGYGVLWETTDGGETWLPSSLQPPGVIITALGVDPIVPRVVYAGGMRVDSSFAFYYSGDAGETWQEVPPPGTQSLAGVSSLAVAHLSGAGGVEQAYAFIGTLGTGVWRFAVPTVTGVYDAHAVPDRFQLNQNYPNPFNSYTRIEFSLPAVQAGNHVSTFVSLKVYDVLGREVAVLVDETIPPGTYEVYWDAANFPSGVYVYRLEVGGHNSARKMLLLR
jgi:hypothetical protein